MKQKYINIFGSLCLGACLTSCADWLDVEPQNEVTLEKFWNEKADVDNMVAGCYAQMASQSVVERLMVWGEFRSENVKAGNDITGDINLEKVLSETLNAQNSYANWAALYTVINDCNTVLKYAPSVAAKDPNFSDGELRATEAEMKALRALCYFYLIRTFRDVPYSTEAYTDDDQEINLPQTSFDTVLANIIADLESVKDQAITNYPVTTPLYQTARITKQAIWAMLCDMYLWQRNYAKCIEYADRIIDKRKDRAEDERYYAFYQGNPETFLAGYPLNLDQYSGSAAYTNRGNAYSNIFIEGNDKMESIFELSYEKGNDNAVGNGAVNVFYGNDKNSGRGRVMVPDYLGTDISAGAYNVFEKETKKLDNRYFTFINSIGSEYGVGKFVASRLSCDWTDANKPQITRMIYADGKNKSNWIVYRLTDIMLMKAEAMAAMLPDSGATADDARAVFNIVNVVNKRSIAQYPLKDTITWKTDYQTKDNLVDLVYKERERELMFEGKRWYDLVRYTLRCQAEGKQDPTSYLSQHATQKQTSGASAIQLLLKKVDAIFWPVFLDELKTNPNLQQNPAFNSGENEGYEKTK